MSTRRNIVLPDDWWEEFRKLATAQQKTLSELIRDTLAELLPSARRKKLSTPRGVRKPRKDSANNPK